MTIGNDISFTHSKAAECRRVIGSYPMADPAVAMLETSEHAVTLGWLLLSEIEDDFGSYV